MIIPCRTINQMIFRSLVAILLIVPLGSPGAVTKPFVALVTDSNPGKPALHGIAKLTEALQSKHIAFEKVGSVDQAKSQLVIVCGLSNGDGVAARLLKEGNHTCPQTTEALTIWKTAVQKKTVLLVSGFDDRGLMYALLDVATRIGWSAGKSNPLSEIKEITEQPAIAERALSVYTMNRAYWESRFYDESYWTKYLDMLAENRYNMFTIVFGYEASGFMAPVYPYFFNVDGFSEVNLPGITSQEQKRNVEALNRLIQMAHDRGIGFTAGIWDHIFRGGVQEATNPGSTAGNVKVTGLNGDNLIPYTKAALIRFIKVFPGVDVIQFRMHDESGLKQGEQEGFWKGMFQAIKADAPNIHFVLRAKGLPDSIIQNAYDAGVNFSIGTKYWMEQMGLPYHPTHIPRQNQQDRRHSYADLLRYPQQYKMYWRLWNGGTNRILLWGDPEYARRFAESTRIYDSSGYEVNEPLATKMASESHDAKPFDLMKPEYKYYTWEFERYWHFYQVFGRMGYNLQTSPDVWQKEFEIRFGKKAAPVVESALHKASQVLPRIVASCYPYSHFPTTRGWAEKQRLGDLPEYAKGDRSDSQQFASFEEEAQLLIENGETAKILPSVNSRWFGEIAADINSMVAKAESSIGNNRNKEFNSTIVDLKILANLATYHSRRIPAAVSYCLFQQTKDVAALNAAIAYERGALEAWKQVVAAAGDVYADNLLMGLRVGGNDGVKTDLTGHWRTELVALEKGLDKLQEQRNNFKADSVVKPAPVYKPASGGDYAKLFRVVHLPITNFPVGKPLTVSVKISAQSSIKWVRLRYRAVNQRLDYQLLPMTETNEKGVYQATVPADQINPKWDFMYLIEMMDSNGRGAIYPDLSKETPYVVVKLDRE
jgi:hypothetical protein